LIIQQHKQIFIKLGAVKIKFDWCESVEIPTSKAVRVKRMNHILEVVSLKTENNGFQNLKKISKTEYVLLDSGEIMEYSLTTKRVENLAGLKKSFRKIRDLINNNFTGAENELHVTLTYRENMTDTVQLANDFKLFKMRLKWAYEDLNLEYLTIVEPQGRGAWHHHLLLKSMNPGKLFIPSADIERLWGYGFVKVKSLQGVDNIGAYLSAYLTDVEIPQDEDGKYNILSIDPQITNKLIIEHQSFEIKDVVDDKGTKKYLKGGRCWLYPRNFNIYRKSKGIVHPVVEKLQYSDIKKIVGSATPNYSRTLTISDESEKILNVVTYENYNMNRLNE